MRNQKQQLTRHELAMAAGVDAANRSMRKARRKAWSISDALVAAQEYNRVNPDPNLNPNDNLQPFNLRKEPCDETHS